MKINEKKIFSAIMGIDKNEKKNSIKSGSLEFALTSVASFFYYFAVLKSVIKHPENLIIGDMTKALKLTVNFYPIVSTS